MKTFLAVMVLGLTAPACLQAQTSNIYKVAPGERVDYALLKANALYQYPQFADAQVALKNGTSGTVRMNYNQLLGDMQFINGKGDTLSLDNENEVASIVIAKDTFVFSDGYVQLLHESNVRIGKKTMLKIADRKRIGGMGEVTDGSTMYTSMYSKFGVKDLVPTEALTFYKVSMYFIGDRFNKFKPLNKKNLYAFYAKQEQQIEAYLQANPVNFNQEADVLRLVDFLKTL
jgi:hypothetical protein